MSCADDAVIIVTDLGSEMISDRKENTLQLKHDIVVSKFMTETYRLAPSIKYKLVKGALISIAISFRSKLR
jgi:hypothetical protein